MEHLEIMKYVDHTLLKAYATWEEIRILGEEAIKYNTASVCVPPNYVKRLHDTYGEKLNICTVVGFPLGYSTTEAKIEECVQALKDGVNEIDMVINISDVKNKDYKSVEDEIRKIKEIVGEHILKVIVETCYLTEVEKIEMCHAVTNAGADYIKTSTGFGTGGATLEDVQLFKKYIGNNVRIKASGGIRTLKDMEAFIDAGCSRLGTSSAIKLINNA
ncbi:MAG: deoxyribose-phosphate aldolase [Tissierellia bacterium]|jgi:deoxyribose-phosphate aldolase|nr:deoxyribose-phosphate aldolase [Tissierellia bacterium]MDD3227396.1 deoxyribose-phosphate aldolase [Tissierellia bacterium]MDD4046246.1 deoxyribose-phosphate aldolase [Tissierellia bacterium]MDD4678261.1 deoxyribose-phosphate aldolase [Tissierellia bacterium]